MTCYSSKFGVESMPSAPTDEIELYEGEYIKLSFNIANNVGSRYHYDKIRIYRLEVGTSSADYYYLTEISSGSSEWTDGDATGLDDTSTDALPSTYWNSVLGSAFQGMILFHNSILILWNGNTLYPSEPFYTYAFPEDYRLTFPGNIIGCGIDGETLIVFTEERPYFITGYEPVSFNQVEYPVIQPCLNYPELIENSELGAIFPSTDGLLAINGGRLVNLTEGLYTKEQWQNLLNSNIFGKEFDKRYYIGYYGSNTLYEFNFKDNYINDIELDNNINGLCVNFNDDSYNLITDNATGNSQDIVKLYSNDSTDYKTFSWTSKVFTHEIRAGYRWVKVIVNNDSGNATTLSVQVKVDDVLYGSYSIAQFSALTTYTLDEYVFYNNELYRSISTSTSDISSGFTKVNEFIVRMASAKGYKWEVILSGDCEIVGIELI